MSPTVLVSIVTCNSEPYLARCLASVEEQHWDDLTVGLWDNASSDRSLAIAREFRGSLELLCASKQNVGFCAAHNRIIAEMAADYVLVLNPDVILEPSFVSLLVEALENDPEAGAATGKLWRWQPDRPPDVSGSSGNESKLLDSTGMYWTRNQRHLDRGSGEPDVGQYDARAYVFGASGAAAFYRRAMLDDVRSGREYFDEAFFAYREDADLAWRAQWLGWRCLYVPEARGYHVRRVLPERRPALPAAINTHSFKNRFLLRVKNLDAGAYARLFVPITLRDLQAFAYVVLRERSSLRAIPLLWRALPEAWRARRELRRRRRVTPHEMRRWFRWHSYKVRH